VEAMPKQAARAGCSPGCVRAVGRAHAAAGVRMPRSQSNLRAIYFNAARQRAVGFAAMLLFGCGLPVSPRYVR